MKLEYEQGNSAVVVSKDDEEWQDAMSHRTKYYARSLREGKTMNSMMSKVMASLLEHKKHEKDPSLSRKNIGSKKGLM